LPPQDCKARRIIVRSSTSTATANAPPSSARSNSADADDSNGWPRKASSDTSTTAPRTRAAPWRRRPRRGRGGQCAPAELCGRAGVQHPDGRGWPCLRPSRRGHHAVPRAGVGALLARVCLGLEVSRFAKLQGGIPQASPTILARRLKQLEAEGVVERRRSETGRSWTYPLTPAGEEFLPIVAALGAWGQRWSRRELQAHELNVGLLVWAIERGGTHDAFGDRRTVIKLSFLDRSPGRRNYWFVIEGGKTEQAVRDEPNRSWCEPPCGAFRRISGIAARIAKAPHASRRTDHGQERRSWTSVASLPPFAVGQAGMHGEPRPRPGQYAAVA
jgi:DNA-binding HxlR family transcriptional regulator